MTSTYGRRNVNGNDGREHPYHRGHVPGFSMVCFRVKWRCAVCDWILTRLGVKRTNWWVAYQIERYAICSTSNLDQERCPEEFPDDRAFIEAILLMCRGILDGKRSVVLGNGLITFVTAAFGAVLHDGVNERHDDGRLEGLRSVSRMQADRDQSGSFDSGTITDRYGSDLDIRKVLYVCCLVRRMICFSCIADNKTSSTEDVFVFVV